MAKEEKEKSAEAGNEKKIDVAKDAHVGVPVTVISLDGDPYHENGAEFEVGLKKAEELVKRGWVKLKDKK
jgi:hypothetical protein